MVPIVYPLISFEVPSSTVAYNAVLETIIVTNGNVTEYLKESTQFDKSVLLSSMFLAVWAVGTVILFIALCVKLKMIRSLFTQQEVIHTEQIGNCKVYFSNGELSSFSFFNSIYINNNDKQDEILKHEQLHVQYKHSLELVFTEIICILCWWNPLLWLLKREIKINQECMVDQKMIDMGFDRKRYQYSLLTETIKNTSISIINNFNVSQLKKRITMMNKKRTNKFGYSKYLLMMVLPAMLLLVMICK